MQTKQFVQSIPDGKTNIIPIHNCCDVCEKKCSCDDDTCPNTHNVYQETKQEEEAEEEMSR